MMKGKPMIERSREPLFDDAPRPDAPVSGEPPRRSVLEASARLSRLVRLGTLGFGRPYWRGTIYSASSGALRMKGLDGLSVLARTPWLGCVCLERGYLHPHSQAELAVLASAVPADFRFIVRAPALVTSVFVHDRRGRAGGLNREFLNRRSLREKLHGRTRREARRRALRLRALSVLADEDASGQAEGRGGAGCLRRGAGAGAGLCGRRPRARLRGEKSDAAHAAPHGAPEKLRHQARDGTQ